MVKNNDKGIKYNDKRMKIIIAIVVALLVLVITVLAYLNAGDIERKKDLEMRAEFIIRQNSREQRLTMQDILDLDPVDFETVKRTSTSEPTPVTFTGVDFSKLFLAYGFEIDNSSTVQVMSLDGYASAISGQEILSGDNVYLCIYMDGEPMKTKQEGGFGPYLMVIKNDRFAQRWCKFVEVITIK